MSSRSSKKSRSPERPRRYPATLVFEGERLVVVGELAGAHGVRGDLRARLYNPSSRVLDEREEVFLLHGDAVRRFSVRQSRPHGRVWLLRLDSVETPEAAREHVGLAIAVRERDLAPAGDSAYYHYQLLGMTIVDEQGRALGRVHDVVANPAGDLLVFELEGRERMVPFVDAFVKEVDPEARRIVIRPAGGLLDV